MKNIYDLVTEIDQRNIENIQERINLANEWADEIYGIVNSGKQLSDDEWKKQKAIARQYILHLKTIADPRKKIFLHLQENQAMSENLSKRLEQTLFTAIDRLESALDVIESRIETSNKLEPNYKPNAAAWAFYYFILYQIKSPESIENYSEGREAAYKKIAIDNEIKSWKHIQTEYTKLLSSKPTEFLTVKKIPTIRKAIEFLIDNPAGTELAKKYLNIAMENK